MQTIKKAIQFLAKSIAFIGAIITALMMFLTVADVLGRRFFHMPIPGTFELTRFGLVLIVSFGLAYAQIEGENIGITILYDKFPNSVKRVLNLIISLGSIGLFSIVLVNTLKYAARISNANQITSVLRLPVHPWIYISAIGVGVLILALIWDLLNNVLNFKGEISDES